MSLFTQTSNAKPRKNKFNLSHERKLTGNMASLIPIYTQEIIPGDRFKVSSEIMLRLAPLVSPIMHRVHVHTHFFYVRNSIVWDNWQKFITGGEDGLDASVLPKININDAQASLCQKGSLYDYFGLPIPPSDGSITASTDLNALPYRAYQMIFNEYYRDQNLQEKVDFSTGDDAQTDFAKLLQLRTRNWEKDYYTSALPWAQKGDPVTAPIGIKYASQAKIAGGDGSSYPTASGTLVHDTQGNIASSEGATWNEIENIDPDATGIDVENLRIALRLQRWLERNARSGSRYIEAILAHFGERVPDYTAQRPVYLGGGKQNVVISEVLQTAETATTPQGNMAGHGISVGKTNSFKGRFKEHGFVIGIMSILPKTAYQNGIQKFWMKNDKFEYFWPEFAQLGEQPVNNKEIFMDWNQAGNDNTFGYQSRYAEYKYAPSLVSGDFRDNLAYWHMGRIFTDRQALNEEFIQANPRQDVFAVTDPSVHKLYVQIYNDVAALRPIPKFNTPTI